MGVRKEPEGAPARNRTRRAHIVPDKLWWFHAEDAELTLQESVHLVDCEDCRSLLDACFRAQTFVEALEIWKEEDPLAEG